VIQVAGGTFVMGSDRHYPEERPAHPVEVAAFALAASPVTVAEFASFVAATGHVTTAERDGNALVFTPPAGPVDLGDPLQWWSLVDGASWRAPDGRRPAQDDHPVVQVSFQDAAAYCTWAGFRLPTEVEWEAAAQKAVVGNVWKGHFPWDARGLATTSSIGAFGSTGGFSDQLGNVWEWTSTAWTRDHQPACCSAPVTGEARVAKGGSFLCAPEYCARYRPQARMAMAIDSPTCHLGLRVASGAGP
jgi:formylglycine-generating enzyme required for sulfatase activity